jgi:pimeloyl-ACP methyl ester carboxylesterase
MRSPEVGLYNRCEAFMRNDGVAVISLRGTIGKAESWMENFLAAMVTAKGTLQLTDSTSFSYRLAADSQAYVHAGWLIGLGYLSPYINTVMDSLLAAGSRSFIIMGHSQGGALAFLTTSYLHYKYSTQYPDLQLTAYCSAAPKPGNLYYAYDFDFITRNSHSFRIVNTADWVPENPLTVQTVADMKYPNPLADAKTTIRKQKFLVRLALNCMYGKMKKSSEKTMKHYRKYLGSFLFKQVHKALPQLRQPDFVFSSNYMTAGTPVILPADSAYYRKFVFTGKNVFVHHNLDAYLYLLRKYYQ